MKKHGYGAALIAVIGAVFLTACSGGGFTSERKAVLSGAEERESNRSSGKLNSIQTANLEKLCRVWGFAKYYHPAVVAGLTDWDQELLSMIPGMMNAGSGEEADALLVSWLTALDEMEPDLKTVRDLPEDILDTKVTLSAGTDWVTDTAYLSEALSQRLSRLTHVYIEDRSKAYASINEYGFTVFDREDAYENMDYEDMGYRLLGLFRYWNIVEYYYPYREGMSQEWNDTLLEFLPRFAGESGEAAYKTALAQLVSRLEDTHAFINDTNGMFKQINGENIAPVEFILLDGQVVVTGITKSYENAVPLQPGDVIVEIDGKDVSQVIEEKLTLLSVSNRNAITNNLLDHLLRTGKESLPLTVERNGERLETTVVCHSGYNQRLAATEPAGRLIEGTIGYINPAALEQGEITSILEEYWDTEGIIVDMRCYPSDFIVFALGNSFISEPSVFARGAFANAMVPGEFRLLGEMYVGEQGRETYKGKVVILMDERTQSMAEYTVMALRRMPGALVVGSDSIGTDGDIVILRLPGGIITGMTGWGVYTPDGEVTQRIGLKPDVYVRPTLEGIRNGQDEVLERGIEEIRK